MDYLVAELATEGTLVSPVGAEARKDSVGTHRLAAEKY